jgi:hypothetical protein
MAVPAPIVTTTSRMTSHNAIASKTPPSLTTPSIKRIIWLLSDNRFNAPIEGVAHAPDRLRRRPPPRNLLGRFC